MTFAPDLSQVTFSDGNVLQFTEESERPSSGGRYIALCSEAVV